MENLLFYVHYALLLLFGLLLSFAFAGLQLHGAGAKKNFLVLTALFVLSGLLQLGAYARFSEALVWKIYPLITHLPLLLCLCLYYRRPIATALAAVCTAYLCCQPAKWAGALCLWLSKSPPAQQGAEIAVLLLVGFVSLVYLAPYMAQIFQKDSRSVWIFGSVPMVYYGFDYVMSIYTGLWESNYPAVAEFLPFFLCLAFLFFCFAYYKEYEQKADAKQKEQIIRITVEQQAKEMEAIRRSEQETRLLRHDMRLFLGSLSLCIESGDTAKAQEMLASYTSMIEGTKLLRFCGSDIINYVLSDYAAKCQAQNIAFSHSIKLETLPVNELMFAAIVSNAMDNALNAQLALPPEERKIRLLLKTLDGKLLLSVENPIAAAPVFSDGLPVTDKKDHGYGTRSIRYMTERLGGNCQFTTQNGQFILRVIL